MRRRLILTGLITMFALAVVLNGCAKPPLQEKSAASDAMSAAVTAGADKYALNDMGAAEKLLDQAEANMAQKKYTDAKKSYEDAKAAFEKAAAGVDAGKKAMIDQNNADLATIGKQWVDVTTAAKKLGKKMKAEDLKGINADGKVIADDLKAAKDSNANDPATALAKLNEVKSLIGKWNTQVSAIK